MKNKGKIYKKLLLIIALLYVSVTFVNQQKTLDQYKQQETDLKEKIQEKKEYNEELASTKENVNSLDFIEEIAREKLNMYLPNERVYIDQGM